MRFDRVIEHKKNVSGDEIVNQFSGNEKSIILGSSWSIDEAFFENFIKNNYTKYKFIIAPHDISEKHLKEIEQRFPKKTIRYGNFEKQFSKQNILIIDCIGKLSNIYQYGELAYIGGGFTGHLHNILEPAVFGLPIIFGPKHKGFPEGQLFIDTGVAFSIADSSLIQEKVNYILDHKLELEHKLNLLIKNNTGAVDKILAKIF
jgi:3-deoxy-D-manno-octulosonic-acid transferase